MSCIGLILLVSSLAPQSPLGEAVQEFAATPALRGARVGVAVRDLESGQTLAEHDADRGFMTASNMKLISSAVALVTLGSDYRFQTTVVGAGPVTDGVLQGDLLLVGSGDPSFGDVEDPATVMDALAAQIVERHGIERIAGDVLGDDDCHPDEVMGEGWAWGYQGASYAAQISGLCFGINCVTLRLEPATAAGRAPRVSLVPATSYFDVDNRATTAAAGSRSVWADRERATNRLVVGGRLPASAPRWSARLSVENPTAYAATCLHEALVRRGVKVGGIAMDRDDRPARPDRYGDERVLATHRSEPLAQILRRLNKDSQNLYAEQVVRAAARHARGKGGMLAASAHAKATLTELGVDIDGMRLADGSGLTRLNLVKPAQLVALLAGMHERADFDVYLETLPIAGVDGTLGRRFRDTPAAGRVRAKTGYISSVVALSGFVPRDDDRKPVVFSILVNNFTCRVPSVQAAVDDLVSRIVAVASSGS